MKRVMYELEYCVCDFDGYVDAVAAVWMQQNVGENGDDDDCDDVVDEDENFAYLFDVVAVVVDFVNLVILSGMLMIVKHVPLPVL